MFSYKVRDFIYFDLLQVTASLTRRPFALKIGYFRTNGNRNQLLLRALKA